MFRIKCLAMRELQMHTDAAILKHDKTGLWVCTGDNPLAKARGVSSRSDAHHNFPDAKVKIIALRAHSLF